jgi:hypothetical protein
MSTSLTAAQRAPVRARAVGDLVDVRCERGREGHPVDALRLLIDLAVDRARAAVYAARVDRDDVVALVEVRQEAVAANRLQQAAEAETAAAGVDEQRADPVRLVGRRDACDGDADLLARRPAVVERHGLRGALDIWRIATRLPVERLGLRSSPRRYGGRSPRCRPREPGARAERFHRDRRMSCRSSMTSSQLLDP